MATATIAVTAVSVRKAATRAVWRRTMGWVMGPSPSQPPPQGGRCRFVCEALICHMHNRTPSPLWGGLGRGRAASDMSSSRHRRFAAGAAQIGAAAVEVAGGNHLEVAAAVDQAVAGRNVGA